VVELYCGVTIVYHPRCAQCGTARGAIALYAASAMCQGCKRIKAKFGLLADRKRRWCRGCAKGHAGAVHLDSHQRKCVDCTKKAATYGLPAEGEGGPTRKGVAVKSATWRAGCAKAHSGAISISKKCEDCQKLQPSFGLPGATLVRWCGGCAKGHPGAVSRGRKCEGCHQKSPSFGRPWDERMERWC
jgi:hypothetical protein